MSKLIAKLIFGLIRLYCKNSYTTHQPPSCTTSKAYHDAPEIRIIAQN